MVATRSGATPAARRASGSRPRVGPMLLPEPVSTSAYLPARSSKNAFTAMGSESPGCLPASRAVSAVSMPSTTSSGAASTPSLSAVTAMSPICLLLERIIFFRDFVAIPPAASPPLRGARHDLDQLLKLTFIERRRQKLELDRVLHALVEAGNRRGLQALLRDEVLEHQPHRRFRQAGKRDIARHRLGTGIHPRHGLVIGLHVARERVLLRRQVLRVGDLH